MAKATETTTKRVRVKKPTTGHPAIKAVTSTNHKTTAIKAEPKVKVVKAAKPTLVKHDFASNWTGASDGVNLRVSRTAIPVDRFNTRPNDPLTERDRANLTKFRDEFGGKAFERGNLDAGILKRLGERGYLKHVSGAANEATAKFALTAKKVA